MEQNTNTGKTYLLGTTSDLFQKARHADGSPYTEFDAVRELAEIGFDALDYGIFYHQGADGKYWNRDWEDYAKRLSQTAKEAGIIFSQAHAPMFSMRDLNAQEQLDLTRRSFRIAQILGAPYLVIHPQMFPENILGGHHEEILRYNLNYYQSLLEYSIKTGVKIALENMFGYDPDAGKLCITYFSLMEDILEFLDRVESREQFVVCLDTGHANIIGKDTPADCIRKLGKDLKLLHTHDNYGESDDHMPPFFGNIDWKDTIAALREVHYDGVLSLEAASLCIQMPSALARKAAEFTYQTVKEISTY